MYINPTDRDASEAREGIWKEPWNTYWESSLIFDNVVYDLGRFGNGAEAGIAYATALLAFRESECETSGHTGSDQLSSESLDHHRPGRQGLRADRVHDRLDEPNCLFVQGGSEVAR